MHHSESGRGMGAFLIVRQVHNGSRLAHDAAAIELNFLLDRWDGFAHASIGKLNN